MQNAFNIFISIITLSFILKLFTMENKLAEIEANLELANQKVENVKKDVEGLHADIQALGDAPTAEQIEALKVKSEALVASLTAVDELTEDKVQDNGPGDVQEG